MRGARAGHIAVSTVEGVCGALLPEVIGTLRARAPRVTIAVSTMGSFAIPDAIAAGDADVGVAFALRRAPELRQVAVSRFKLGAIVPPDHPLASRRTVSLAACLDHPIILATPELSINQLLGPALARLPRSFEPCVTASSIELMRELAERGAGIAFQTRIGLERQLADGRLVHVPLDNGGPVWSDLGVYVRAGRSLPAVLDLFLQILAGALAAREQLENARG
nr:LysR substrate-binding domain-containing protein [Rhodoplanes tepidamans]